MNPSLTLNYRKSKYEVLIETTHKNIYLVFMRILIEILKNQHFSFLMYSSFWYLPMFQANLFIMLLVATVQLLMITFIITNNLDAGNSISLALKNQINEMITVTSYLFDASCI